MNISSLIFFIFIFCSLFLYYILPKRVSYISLVVSSLIFLFYNNLNITNILVVSSIFLVAYISGFLIEKFKNQKLGKFICILSVLIIIFILGLLKYSSFFIELINSITNSNLKPLNISYPIGISYFTLIMIGYIVDTYWDTNKCEKNPIKMLLFMIYYPILTSGPFIEYSEINDKIYDKHKFNINNITAGLSRMLLGLIKVLVISSRLGIFVNYVYDNLGDMNGILVIMAILLYTIQLYTNFSGSIDIIIGVSNMYGIDLPENFDNPFLSKSITEFWRKWHITLGNWLRKYIFYPLYKSDFIQNLTDKLKKIFKPKVAKKITLYLCLFILWLTIGFWHGGAFKYILASGILQFIFIVFEDLMSPLMKKYTSSNKKIISIISIVRVFVLFSLSMVFFRADSIIDGIDIIGSIFNTNKLIDITEIISVFDIILLIISILFIFIFENKREENIEKLNKLSIDKKAAIILIVILFIIVFGMYGIGFNNDDFIYSRF